MDLTNVLYALKNDYFYICFKSVDDNKLLFAMVKNIYSQYQRIIAYKLGASNMKHSCILGKGLG